MAASSRRVLRAEMLSRLWFGIGPLSLKPAPWRMLPGTKGSLGLQTSAVWGARVAQALPNSTGGFSHWTRSPGRLMGGRAGPGTILLVLWPLLRLCSTQAASQAFPGHGWKARAVQGGGLLTVLHEVQFSQPMACSGLVLRQDGAGPSVGLPSLLAW